MRSIGKRNSRKNIFIRRRQFFLLFAVAALAAVIAPLPRVVAQTPEGLRSNAILDHLNAVIDWYRNTLTRVPAVGLPSDAVYQFNAQNMALEVIQLAFQSAQAEAPLVPAASAANVPGAGTATSQQSLAKMQSDVKARISVLEAQISDLNQQIAKAPKATRQQLTAQRESAQGELDLRKATSEAFDQMAQFVSNNGEGGKGGLEGSINELRRSVPELSNTGAKAAAKPPAAGAVDALQRRLDRRSHWAL